MPSAPHTVSVVIPVHQGERFVGEAIASVRAQTLPAAELIVVDDRSTDASAEVARQAVAGWPAATVVGQENAGPSAARNAGVALATGDLLTFLDADDRMTPDRLEHQVAHLSANPGLAVVVGCEWIELDEGIEPPEWLRAIRRGAPNPYILSMMVRREAFERVGGFDPGRRLGEEIDWIYRARVAGLGIEMVEHVYTLRRIHGANTTTETSMRDIHGVMFSLLRRHMGARDAPG